MTGTVYVALAVAMPARESLAVLDPTRRLYAGLSRDGAYWHVVHPAQVDMVNAENAVIRSTGQLICTCKGSAFRGTCYRVLEAEAFEAGLVAPVHGPHCDADLRRNGCVCEPEIAWLADAAPGEITEVYGS